MNYKTIQFATLEEVSDHPLKPVTVMVSIIEQYIGRYNIKDKFYLLSFKILL